ncbi:hypothetical protein Hanom_Chr05g00422451 [Helianthus anomalus]
MMKGPIYSRMVEKGGAVLPTVIGRQLSDQGEYPLGLLCCGQGSSTRGAPVFSHAGNVVVAPLGILMVRSLNTFKLGPWIPITQRVMTCLMPLDGI